VNGPFPPTNNSESYLAAILQEMRITRELVDRLLTVALESPEPPGAPVLDLDALKVAEGQKLSESETMELSSPSNLPFERRRPRKRK